jgi:hypothetical protein
MVCGAIAAAPKSMAAGAKVRDNTGRDTQSSHFDSYVRRVSPAGVAAKPGDQKLHNSYGHTVYLHSLGQLKPFLFTMEVFSAKSSVCSTGQGTAEAVSDRLVCRLSQASLGD